MNQITLELILTFRYVFYIPFLIFGCWKTYPPSALQNQNHIVQTSTTLLKLIISQEVNQDLVVNVDFQYLKEKLIKITLTMGSYELEKCIMQSYQFPPPAG
jgi:hypothetical protein